MNAADVLAEAWSRWHTPEARMENRDIIPSLVAALLAHGEQGVAILPDGTLWRLLAANEAMPGVYHLVPLWLRPVTPMGDWAFVAFVAVLLSPVLLIIWKDHR